MQGGWMNKEAYSQLPNFGKEEIGKIKSLMNNKTICKYAEMTSDERKEIAPKLWGDNNW